MNNSKYSQGSRNTFTESRQTDQNPTSAYTQDSYRSPGMFDATGPNVASHLAFGAGTDVAHNLVRGTTGK